MEDLSEEGPGKGGCLWVLNISDRGNGKCCDTGVLKVLGFSSREIELMNGREGNEQAQKWHSRIGERVGICTPL